MLKLSLYKDSNLTNEVIFKTQEELDSFVERHREMETFLLSDKYIGSTSYDGEVTVEIKPATHSHVIVDLSLDYDHLLAECHANRSSEYPPMSEYLDAVVKSDQDQMDSYIEKCLAVKSKYPLPQK